MPALRDLQRGFARAMLGSPGDMPACVVAGGLDPLRRLAVYRNNVQHSLLRVVEGSFPATRRQAGEAVFRELALAFLRAHPPAQPQLLTWGAGFPGFVSGHPAVAGSPWLAPLAALEWAREEVYYAADASPLVPQALAGVPSDRYPTLRLILHPTARLMASDWPIHTLWRDAAAVPAACPERVLVVRPAMDVRTLSLGPGEWALLEALAGSAVVAEAAAAALSVERDLDLQATLAAHLAGGTFAGFH